MRAADLLRDALRPADELAAEVDEREERVDGQRVRFCRPKGVEGALPAVVLCHGAQEDGIDDPRLMAFARALALRGAEVAAPDFATLRGFRIDPGDPDRLARLVARLAEGRGRVAMVGISFGGSYSIVAAGRPAIRERVSAVLGFGSYADLEVLLRTWLTDPAPPDPPSFAAGRRAVLLGNVDRLAPPRDRGKLRSALRRLLDGDDLPADPRGLSARGRLVLKAARAAGPVRPGAADRLIAPLAADLAAVRAGDSAPAAPVFLLHGAADPIIPPANARLLAERLHKAGVDVRLCVSSLFAHVEPAFEGRPSIFRAWPLLRFTARFLHAAGL